MSDDVSEDIEAREKFSALQYALSLYHLNLKYTGPLVLFANFKRMHSSISFVYSI